MDRVVQSNIDELIAEFKKQGQKLSDPVGKLMVTALLHQAQKIKDEIAALPDRVSARLAEYFIPKNKIDATPAMCLLQPQVKSKKGVETHVISEGTYFTYKVDAKSSLSYYPLYRSRVLPVAATHLLTEKMLISRGVRTPLNLNCKGKVWLGLEMAAEVDTLEGVSFYIKRSDAVLPEKILVGNEMVEVAFTPAQYPAGIPMMEPFDSQQVNSSTIEMFSNIRQRLSDLEGGCLVYITDRLTDRDVFKYRAFPKAFQQYLESSDLDRFENNTLWILFDYGEGSETPEDIEIVPNVIPALNVNLNTVTLTQTSPISRLTKGDGTYFLNIVETSLPSQKQGFDTINEDVVVRDFDVSCYDSGILHRDIRNLYNRFIEDYYAFIEYHALKDGTLIKSLRDVVNRIGKSVKSAGEVKERFDEGVYVMRGVGLIGKSTPVKVSYLTTNGSTGNLPTEGMLMENKKDAALEKDVRIITSGEGGEDKATADQMYEMLRYYTLTADRLFTKMDIDGFLRLQLLKEFGKDEMKRITQDIYIQGAPGSEKLERGLYIDIKFKDEKNYRKATGNALDRKFHQMIVDRSCIAMPIIVSLINAELK